MTTCCDRQQQAILDGDLAADHCACDACEAFAMELALVAETLGELEPPALPIGFETRMGALLRAEEEARAPRAWWRWALGGLTAAAAAIAFIVMTPSTPETPIEGTYLRAELAWSAAVVEKGVQMTLILPEGLTLVVHEQLKALRWTADVGPTPSRQPIALHATKAGRWPLRLKAERPGGGSFEETLWVEVEPNTSGQLSIRAGDQTLVVTIAPAGGDHDA